MDEQCDSRPAVCSPPFLVADSRSHRAWHWNAQSRGRFGSLCGPKRCSPREDFSSCNSAPITIRIQTAGDSIASPPTTSGLRPRQLRCPSKPSIAYSKQGNCTSELYPSAIPRDTAQAISQFNQRRLTYFPSKAHNTVLDCHPVHPPNLFFPFTSKVITQKLRTGRTVPKFRILTGVVGSIPLRM